MIACEQPGACSRGKTDERTATLVAIRRRLINTWNTIVDSFNVTYGSTTDRPGESRSIAMKAKDDQTQLGRLRENCRHAARRSEIFLERTKAMLHYWNQRIDELIAEEVLIRRLKPAPRKQEEFRNQ